MEVDEPLRRGREAYARRAWRDAYEALCACDPLPADDAELAGVAALMLGRDDECAAFLEQAHRCHLEAGDTLRAVRAAFWIGMSLAMRGETGPGAGWLGRAQRLLEHEPRETADHGYLLLPVAYQQQASGDRESAAATAARAAEIGDRFGDADLFALGAHVQGHALVNLGRLDEGLRLLDEAMVAATSSAQLPMVTGMVYCGVILACAEAYEVRRAQEWTEALTRWCGEQPQLVAFTGRCLIHRAELLQLRGDWHAALEEARRAEERLEHSFNRPATAQAFYRQGELRRLRGELAAAERAYRAASRYGFEPQPGLALLRLAQGRADAAAASIGRALIETDDRSRRASLLPAAVEIALERGDVDTAREAAGDLEAIAVELGSALLAATAAHALGAVRLAEDEPAAALAALRRACEGFEELAAPYEAARVRMLIGRACRLLGDDDSAELELAAARETFAGLGAAPAADEHGLTARELEVLRLLAGGRSNRGIAAALVISEHTVARHLQNIYCKLGVSSRTAASAFAHEHHLV